MKYLSIFAIALLASSASCNKQEVKGSTVTYVSDYWAPVGVDSISTTGNTTDITNMVIDGDGTIYISGGKSVNAISKWDGNRWVPYSIFTEQPLALANDNRGNIFVKGTASVYRWNGSSWSRLDMPGSSIIIDPSSLTLAADGAENVYTGIIVNKGTASEQYTVGWWNGKSRTWTNIGRPPALQKYTTPISLQTDSKGTLYAIINDQNNRYYIAQWDGNSWSEFGKDDPLISDHYIRSMAVDRKGNIYAAGGEMYTNAGKMFVAKWDGSRWQQLPGFGANSFASNMATDGSGNLYVDGGYADEKTLNPYLYKWDGSQWAKMIPVGSNGQILCIACDDAGNIYASGSFRSNRGVPYVAKYLK